MRQVMAEVGYSALTRVPRFCIGVKEKPRPVHGSRRGSEAFEEVLDLGRYRSVPPKGRGSSLVPVQGVSTFLLQTASGGAMEADIRIIVATFTGFVAFAAVSAQVEPSSKNDNWRPLDTALSFGLGDQACGYGWHQALRRDWLGQWWWGPCVPNK